MTINFSISADTLNNAVDTGKLLSEIQASSITIAVDSITTNGNMLSVNFKADVSVDEQATLLGLVNAHDGVSEAEPAQTVQLSNLTANAHIPKVAVYEAEGDFSSVVSHNFSDNTTWPALDNSTFILEPDAGDRMFLKKAEVQFMHDIQLNGVSELYFDVWVYNPLVDLGSPIDADDDTFVPGVSSGNPLRFLYERKVYTSILDVLNIGNAHYTMEPVDGFTHSLTTVQFNYPRAIPLLSSQGGQVRCSSKDNVELGGTFCTITFSTSSEVED